MNARLTGEAAREGLTFRLDRLVVGNTFDAHRLIHFAATVGRRDAMVERLFVAYLGEGEAIGDPDLHVRLAAEAGLDADAAREVLASDRFADAVRADEARARDFGIRGVPFFAIDERCGVSGAQRPETLLAALQQAWREATPAGAEPAGGCDDGSCAV
jgi:predicted DsbA family dithiol-disulfide isomerase